MRAAGGAMLLAGAAWADTTITISTNVVTPDVRRLGLDIAMINYYDSGQLLKELVFNNPGFEGLLFSSVIQLGAGTATNGVESMPFTSWPSGFWAGASYEFIYGAVKGRTGTIVACTNPRDPGANTNGMAYAFGDSGAPPAAGDWMILRKTVIGDEGIGGNAWQGWSAATTNGGWLASERADLPANTLGRQCVRLTATNAGAQATVSAAFDSWRTARFILMDGPFRLAFKAKGAGGANQLLVSLRRGSEPHFINQTVQLTNDWRDYTISFTAAETNTGPALVLLRFGPVNQSALLLDDVSLRQTDGDPANVSEFRDPVVAAIDGLRPGFLRYPNWQHYGDSLDNALAPPFARMRTEYGAYATSRPNIQLGLHDFLVLCESRGCNPWFSTPIVCSTGEYANLMEYFGGPTNTPYGARRAALGHPEPWTDVFSTLYVEFGNESWNPVFRGGALFDVYAFGARGNELFGAARSSPWYDPAKFLFVLGEQAVSPWRLGRVHQASTNHDLMCVGPYLLSQLDSFATQEEIYGPLYAEPEWWCRGNGFLQQHYTNLQASSRPVPLAVYEFNLNVPNGNPSQAACDSYQATIGGSLAVAHMMLLMLHDQHVRDQGLFSLAGFESPATGHTSALWSVVHDMGVTDRKRPQYLAARMENDALAGDMISTAHAGDDPTWTVTNLNRVSFANAHCLHSYAFATRTNCSLIVFNLSRSNALPVRFAGYHPPRGTVQMQRLSSPNITDHNERSNVVAIAYSTITNFDPAATFALPPFSMTLLQWPAPRITTASMADDGALHLAWPASGFTLQATSDLRGGSWTNIAGGTNAVAIPVDGERVRFFRLVD
jgi:hypothetical protein